jgi:serine phosphatase RsbU (regulator of sigma subunit)
MLSKFRTYWLFLLFILFSNTGFAIESEADDYERITKEFYQNLYNNRQRAIEINDTLLYLYKKEKKNLYLYSYYHNSAYLSYVESDFARAAVYFDSAYMVSVELQDTLKITGAIMNKGAMHYSMNKYADALECYLKSGDLMKKYNPKQLPGLYGNIGMLYSDIQNFDKAIYYLELAISMNNENKGDPFEDIKPLNVLGIIYKHKGEFLRSKKYYHVALSLAEEAGDKYLRDRGDIHTNLAELERMLGNKKQEFYHLEKSLELYQKTKNKDGMSTAKIGLAKYYAEQNNIPLAEKFIKEAKDLSAEFDISMRYKMQLTSLHAEIEAKKGNHIKAFQYMSEAFVLKDSLHQLMNLEEASKMELQFDFNLKNTLDSLKRAEEAKILELKLAEEKAITDAKLYRQRIFTGIAMGGTLFLLVFAFVLYKAYRNKEKANRFIQSQKEIIEEKQQEILDSINYAERIQRSFLATKIYLDEHLNKPATETLEATDTNYFVFFQPKDVVSGDFYWASILGNGHFAFCCADSTGHGVPGAIMSILNISSLEKAIETEVTPDRILDKTRKIIIERLSKDGSPEGGKDGMDCSLLVFNREKTRLAFAAAHTSIFIIRENSSEINQHAEAIRSKTHELIEFKGDKIPVGKHDNDNVAFKAHSIDLQKGDTIYAFTDGFPDQFGGEKGKKYMIKNLKIFLLSIAHLPMKEQEVMLREEFTKWKGYNEQVDDVCIIGVRV